MADHRRPEKTHRGPLPGTWRFAALDFETANYTPASACAVGVVVVEDGRIVRRVSRLIRPPGRHFQFTWLHGIRLADVENEDLFPAVWAEIRPLLARGSFVAAHNAAFDARVLAAFHDVGKFSTGFQNKGFPPATPVSGHVQDMLALFGDLPSKEQELLLDSIPKTDIDAWAPEEAAFRLLVAAISHHGRPYRAGENHQSAWWAPPGNRRPGFSASTVTVPTRSC